MGTFYDDLVTPKGVIGLIIVFIVIIWKELAPSYQSQGLLFYLLILLTILIGGRMIQACFLAKRDYQNIKPYGLYDIIIFLALLCFTTGVVIRIILGFGLGASETVYWIFVTYAVFAIIGCSNFFLIRTKRVEKDSDKFDYQIERAIQAVNIAVLLVYTLVFVVGAYVTYDGVSSSETKILIVYIILCALTTIVNMEHSHRLTYRPKILLSNECDSLSKLVLDLQALFSKIPSIGAVDTIHVTSMLSDIHTDPTVIRTVRATKKDAPVIARLLVKNFNHTYSYIAGENSLDVNTQPYMKLVELLRRFIISCYGFSTLGYMQFYFILNASGQRVGLFKVSTSSDRPTIYWMIDHLWSHLWLSLWIMCKYGPKEFLNIIRRVKLVQQSQRLTLQHSELSLDYLIICDEYRKQGYATAFLGTLLNAYLVEDTDEVGIDRVRTIVREGNIAAMKLLERAGFLEEFTYDGGLSFDPVSTSPVAGYRVRQLKAMVCKRTE